MTLHIARSKQIVLPNGTVFNCSKIDRVGLEFEGLFFEIPDFKGKWHSDGSVRGFNETHRSVCNDGRTGEFVSNAIQPNEVTEFIEKNHPSGSKGRTNYSCGGHVHISLNSNADYMTLLNEKFYDHFVKKWIEFGNLNQINEGSAFWNRLNGICRGMNYCRSGFKGITQSKSKYYYCDDRYQFINYCFNVEHDSPRKKTLEFRIPPMFQKSSLQNKAVLEILKIVQEYLEINIPQKPITLRLKI